MGAPGLVFTPIISDRIAGASFRTGNRGEKGSPDELFIDDDDAIKKLSPIFPDPAPAKAQRK